MSDKKKPEIRFPEFTDDWEQRKLREIADKVTTKNTGTQYVETLTNSAEFGIISQRDFFDHDVSNIENIDVYYIVEDDAFVYNPRISSSAPVGPINRNKLGRTGIMSPLYTVFKTHDVDSEYLEWFFKSTGWHSYMKFNGDSGARSDRFSIKDAVFFDMPIPTPDIDEQKKIGNYLTQLEDLITLHQRKCDKLKEYKKGCLQKMFPRAGANAPEVRFPGFTGAWEQRKLGEMLSLENGYAFQSEFFVDEKTGLVVATPGNVSVEAGFICEGGKNYSVDGPCPKRFIFQPGDIFITMTDLTPSANTLGKPAIVPDNGITYLHNQRLGKLVDFEGDKGFLFALLCTDNYHAQMVKTASGTTVRHSSPDRILSYEALFPKKKEQVLIGQYFSNLDNLITLHQHKYEKYKELKNGLLQKMFI